MFDADVSLDTESQRENMGKKANRMTPYCAQIFKYKIFIQHCFCTEEK